LAGSYNPKITALKVRTNREDSIMTNKPQAFNQVIGNGAAIDRIKREITKRNGLGGCLFFLQGEAGNGKSMLAKIITGLDPDADVYDERRIDPPRMFCKLMGRLLYGA
jgi:transcriptional regulator with PAS, ATPase and Fis domain